MAVAAVGTFAAWHHAATRPQTAYVVAARPIPPGHVVAPGDLRLVPLTLGHGVSAGAFTDPAAAAGRVALGPVDEGELVQAAVLSEGRQGDSPVEVSFALPRDRAVDGRLRNGDRVDVFATEGDRTRAVLERVLVVTVTNTGNASVMAGGDVMVTVGLDDPADRSDLIHALRLGEVTLARSTLAGPADPGEGEVRSDEGDS